MKASSVQWNSDFQDALDEKASAEECLYHAEFRAKGRSGSRTGTGTLWRKKLGEETPETDEAGCRQVGEGGEEGAWEETDCSVPVAVLYGSATYNPVSSSPKKIKKFKSARMGENKPQMK